MDLKKIGKIIGASIGSFLVITIATYFLFSYLNSEDAEEFKGDEQEAGQFDFEPDTYVSEGADSLQNHIGELQKTIDSLKTLDEERQSKVDSLNDYIAQLEQENEETKKAAPKEITAEDLKDVSRSLLNMEEEALSPILKQLSTKQLTGLYNSANNMQRAKLLRSLEPDEAATILNEVM